MPDVLMEWLNELEQFHLLRPWWLLAIPLGIALLYWRRKRQLSQGSWANVIAPQWRPFLLEGQQQTGNYQWLWALLLVLAGIGLSGPTWQQLPQPVHKSQGALVILLDLSPSMLANDIKPNRLTRVRHKLIDILRERKEGVTALVVYGGDAHLVSPLTDDTSTIASQVNVLHPNLMASMGSNVEDAIDLAKQLLKDGGHNRGDILLLTDGVAPDAREYLSDQLDSTIRLTVMGIGTADGAPIPLAKGGFVKDRSGSIVVAKLEREALLRMALNNGGQYTDLATDDSDLRYLQQRFEQPIIELDNAKQLERTFDSWNDQGHWLALLVLPLALLLFRRGVVLALLITPMLIPQPAQAEDADTNYLWQTGDQKGQQAFQADDFSSAQQHFNNPNWKGSAAYRAGDYEAALEAFQQDNSASGFYNQGNTLAQLGKLDEAQAAYEKALELDPTLEDAAANKKVIEELKKQQQSQQQQGDGEGDQNQQGNDQKSSDQQDSDQQNSDQKNSDRKNSDQQNSNQNGEQSQGDSQQDQNPSDSEKEQSENAQSQPSADGSEQEQDQEQKQEQPLTAAEAAAQQAKEDEAKRAMEQFLRKVPDDPGAFLREKFKHQANQRRQQWGESRRGESERW